MGLPLVSYALHHHDRQAGLDDRHLTTGLHHKLIVRHGAVVVNWFGPQTLMLL
jgi:hypothetical protein